jgi:hypothetical protein
VSEAKEELQRLCMEDELRDCAVLVLANKQDLPCAMTCSEMYDARSAPLDSAMDPGFCHGPWILPC